MMVEVMIDVLGPAHREWRLCYNTGVSLEEPLLVSFGDSGLLVRLIADALVWFRRL